MSYDLLPMTRSGVEAHSYMSLVPSVCGEIGFEAYEQGFATAEDGTKIWEFVASCPRCGEVRRFTFPVSPDPAPWPAFGGPEPSRLLTPADFLVIGERAASLAPADPTDLPLDELQDAYNAMAGAVASLEEVLKFPPDQYDRHTVLAILGAYREVLAAYSRVVD